MSQTFIIYKVTRKILEHDMEMEETHFYSYRDFQREIVARRRDKIKEITNKLSICNAIIKGGYSQPGEIPQDLYDQFDNLQYDFSGEHLDIHMQNIISQNLQSYTAKIISYLADVRDKLRKTDAYTIRVLFGQVKIEKQIMNEDSMGELLNFITIAKR